MTITEFLEARIAEDEDYARRAAFGWGADWDSVPDNEDEWSFINAEGKKEMVGSEDADVIIHIAYHDPARVLAECAAKRAIAGLHEEGSDQCDEHNAMFESIECPTIRALAAVYADHPDYRQEWAPRG